VLIDDAPAFAERGVMFDVARDRIPTMATLFALVDHLAAAKINHLQLYHEHSFAYAGHETVWRNADPMTPQQTQELDAYCQGRAIALAGNQNCWAILSAGCGCRLIARSASSNHRG
jgi:hexosaminidase